MPAPNLRRLAKTADAHSSTALVPGWELAALSGLVLFYLSEDDFTRKPESFAVANSLGPLSLIAILTVSSATLAVKQTANLWMCLFWFRVSTAVYFGLGSLAPSFVNQATVEYLDVFFAARPDQIFRVNLLTAVSTLTVLAAARVALSCLPPLSSTMPPPAGNEKNLLLAAVLFGVFGFTIKLLIVVPYTLGFYDASIVAGAIISLDSLAPVSIFLITRYATGRRPQWLAVASALAALEIGVGVLLFNKSEIVITMAMFFLGFCSRKLTLPRVAIGVAALVTLFNLAVPLTDYGRVHAPQLYGETGGNLWQRLDLIQRYFEVKPEGPISEEVQGMYVRLSYANAAAFAMNLHDQGQPGHTLDNAWALPIPRMLWPGKPDITSIGQDFNELALGSRRSSAAPGLFADAYWSFGWWGVPLLLIPMGALFAVASRYAISVFLSGRWMLFPVVLLLMRMGFRVDGFYITDILGPLSFVIVFHAAFSLADYGIRHGVLRSLA